MCLINKSQDDFLVKNCIFPSLFEKKRITKINRKRTRNVYKDIYLFLINAAFFWFFLFSILTDF